MVDSGHVVHEGLSPGEEWFYRVIVVSDEEDAQERSEIVSAATVENDLLSLYLEMDPADVKELYDRDPHSRDRLDAELRLGSPQGAEVDVRGGYFAGRPRIKTGKRC